MKEDGNGTMDGYVSPEWPTAEAALKKRGRGKYHGYYLWIVPKCPYCGKKHTHGGGGVEEDPRQYLGGRYSHCSPGGSYILVEKKA